ncbi:MAG: LPS export ABC transporter permease LptG [Nevskia sp.]|nr:LPS export ABC transporter permease LptG [Nevskia sp.]
MNRLDRYVLRHVLELTAVVGLALVAIYTVVNFLAGLGETGQGDLGVGAVIEYSLLLVPSSLYILMPIVALLGTLLGIGQLARHGELTALRCAGVSLARIGGATLAAGLLLAVLTYALGDWLGPMGERLAAELHESGHGKGADVGKSRWLRDADRVVRIRQLDAADHIREVTVYQLGPDGRLQAALAVDEGRYVDGHWQLSGVRRSDFGADRIQVSRQAEVQIDGGISPKVLQLFILEAGSLSVPGLLRLIAYMDDNHLDAGKYRLLLWRRLVEPFTVMVMMLFAVPFVTGQLRDVGTGQKLLAGALVGIVFYVVNKVSVSLGDLYQWPAPLAAGVPTVLLALYAGWRLRRAS